MDRSAKRLGSIMVVLMAATASFCGTIAYSQLSTKTSLERRVESLELDVAALKRGSAAKDQALQIAADEIASRLKVR